MLNLRCDLAHCRRARYNDRRRKEARHADVTATAAPNDNRIVNADRDCELIAGAEDKGAALIDEDSRASAEETLYVMGAPGMAEKLISAHEESLDDCASADNLGW